VAEDVTTIETVRDLKNRDPFVPFVIVMTSGDRYLVDDPDALAIGGSQLFYYVPRTGKLMHLRINQIAIVEENSERPAA